MNSISISWTPTNYSNLFEQEDSFFYAFVRGNNLLYVGIATKQDVKARVPQSIKRVLKGVTTGVSIWLGQIRDSSYGRITYQMIIDAENLLIYKNQPKHNIRGKNNYAGRNYLRITSDNMPYMYKTITYSK